MLASSQGEKQEELFASVEWKKMGLKFWLLLGKQSEFVISSLPHLFSTIRQTLTDTLVSPVPMLLQAFLAA